MKKKKILLSGLLGISVLAAGITLASCKSIPLSPTFTTSQVTPTTTTTQGQPTTTTGTQVAPTTTTTTQGQPTTTTGTQVAPTTTTTGTQVTPTTTSSQVTPTTTGSQVTPTTTGGQVTPTTGSQVTPTTNTGSQVTPTTNTGDTPTSTTSTGEDPVPDSLSQTATFADVPYEVGQDSKGNDKNYVKTNVKIGDVILHNADGASMEVASGAKTITDYEGNQVDTEYGINTNASNDNRFIEIDLTAYANKKVTIEVFAANPSSGSRTATLRKSTMDGDTVLTITCSVQNEVSKYSAQNLDTGFKYLLNVPTSNSIRIYGINIIEEQTAPVVQSYSLTYVSAYGDVPANKTDVTEITINDLPELTDDNYDFGGWYTDSNCETLAQAGAISSDTTLYAKWTVKASVNTVNVTFVFDNGTDNSVVEIAEGSKVTAPATAPEKDGYAFYGWVLDGETELFNFDTAISEEITLNAVWKRPVSLYYLNVNGQGNPEPGELIATVLADDNETVNLDAPEKAGYTFIAWYTSDSRYHSSSFAVTEPMSLYGYFIQNAFTVTDLTNDGVYNTRSSTNTVSNGKVTFANSIAKDDNGQMKNALYFNVFAKARVTISLDTAITSTDASKYAQIKFYNLAGNSFDTTLLTPSGKTAHNEIVIETNSFDTIYFGRSGNTGITAENIHITVEYDDLNVFEMARMDDNLNITYGSCLISKDQTIYEALSNNGFISFGFNYTLIDELTHNTIDMTQKYSGFFVGMLVGVAKDDYAVTYKHNDNTIKEFVGSVDNFVLYDAFDYKDYYLEGWYSDSELQNEVTATDLQTILNGAESRTLYGKFANAKYLTLKLESTDENNYFEFKVKEGELANTSANYSLYEAPTKTGYTFAGWFNGTEEFDLSTATVSEDITLVAKFDINKYTVTFDSKGGTEIDSQSIEYNNKVTKPSDPSLSGYIFDGWYVDGETEKFDFDNRVITDELTLIAKWNEDPNPKFYLTLDLNYQDAPELAKVVVLQASPTKTMSEIEDPSRTGYNFKGWYEDSSCTTEIGATLDLTSDKTIYAKWVKQVTVSFVGSISIDDVVSEEGALVAAPVNPNLEVAANGLTTTYEILGYYVDNQYSTEWDFASTLVSEDNNTIYVKTRVTNIVFTPTSASDLENNGLFSRVNKSGNTTDFDYSSNCIKYTTGNHWLEFSLNPGVMTSAKITIKGTSGSGDAVGFKLSSSLGEFTTPEKKQTDDPKTFEGSVSYLFSNNTVFKLERSQSKSVYLNEIDIEFTYSFNVTFDDLNPDTTENVVQKVAIGGKASTVTPEPFGTSTFVGWYTSDDNGVTLKDPFDFANTVINSDITLYAKWSDETLYDVKFMDGNTVYSTSKVEENQHASKPNPDPTKEGYVFVGWYRSYDDGETFVAPFDFENEVINFNETLYAKYYDTSVTNVNATASINFKNVTKSDSSSTTVTSNFSSSESFIVKDSTDENYTFTTGSASNAGYLINSSKGLRLKNYDENEYISFTITNTSTINIVLNQANDAERGIAIYNGLTRYLSLVAAKNTVSGYETTGGVNFDASTDIGTNYKRAKNSAINLSMSNCPAGTYYIKIDNGHSGDLFITSIDINTSKNKIVVYDSLSADASLIDNRVVVSNVKLGIKDSTETIALDSTEYKVYQRFDNNPFTNSVSIEVIVKYGDYTTSDAIVVPVNYLRNTQISYDQTTGEIVGSGKDDLVVYGPAPTYHNDGSAQFSSNTEILFSVEAGAKVTIIGHSKAYGVFDILVNFEKQDLAISESGTYEFTVNENSIIVVKTSDNSYSYIKGIKVTNPVSNAALSFVTGGNIANASSMGFDMTAQATSTTEDSSQVKNGNIAFTVAAGTKVRINGYYSVDYKLNDTLVQGQTVDELTKEFVFDTQTNITIECQTGEKEYGNGNYFASIEVLPNE